MNESGLERLQRVFDELLSFSTEACLARLCALAADDPSFALELAELLARDRQFEEEALPDLSGSRLGKYDLKTVLGRGGGGAVYLADRIDPGGQVAIKVVQKLRLREVFVAEQRNLGPLSHPGIATFLDNGTTPDGIPWFALEYVDGRSLTDHAQSLGLRERLALFRATCEAVRYAHGRALIHRDLKPGNVLVDRTGRVRLVDFGIAQSLDNLSQSGACDVTNTETLRLIGTPGYAAPEQYRGQPCAVTTDVYALGVVLYQLLSGRLPHWPMDLARNDPRFVVEMARRVTRTVPPPPSSSASPEQRATLGRMSRLDWRDLDAIVMKAIATAATDRYSSADALLSDLDQFEKLRPISAVTDSSTYRAHKFVRRNCKSLAVAGTLFIVAATLVTANLLTASASLRLVKQQLRRSTHVEQFMNEVLSGGDPSVGPSQDLRVTTLFERALARAEHVEPRLRADVHATIGISYSKLSQLGRAETLLLRALREHERQPNGYGWEVARDHIALAHLYLQAGDRKRAHEHADVAQSTRIPGDVHFDLSLATLQGAIRNADGDYREAAELLDEVIREHSTRSPDDLNEVRAELANSLYSLGRYDEASRLYRDAKQLDEVALGREHPRVADALLNLASVAIARGDYAAAEQSSRHAHRAIVAHYGPTHPETAGALIILARALNSLERHEEADAALTEARPVIEHSYPPVHPRRASLSNELLAIALWRGDLATAEREVTHLVELNRALYPDGHAQVGVSLANLGSYYLAKRDYRSAERVLRGALRSFSATLPSTHLEIAITHTKLARALQLQGANVAALAESALAHRMLAQLDQAPESWLVETILEQASACRALGMFAEAQDTVRRLSVPSR